ncbi:PP2C family protein-serine/threonine phosphatase [Myxococcus sp. Y35]|uniref:PP2C family protein-serine/threonine phosphatase n=1 Tax=Pseudomyxococcus flavus TaxID=3115648 RepID=UPI003CEAA0A3
MSAPALQAQPLAYDVGACTERGLRAYQEDAAGHELGAVSVFAVADGVGGHSNGDMASRAAVDQVLTVAQGEGPATEVMARSTVAQADMAVFNTLGATTLAMLLVSGSRVVVAHVGDSRVYRYRAGVLEQLTQDHRIGRHTLNRALGSVSPACPPEPDTRALDTKPGDVWLLATDGVCDTLNQDALVDVLSQPMESAPRMAERLVRRALVEGSEDNCTALVVRVRGAA